MTGRAIQSDDDAVRAARTLQQTLGVPYVVITLSEAGMAVVGEAATRIPAVAREVFDVTGAGDTVLAALGYGVASGMSVEKAAALANRAAAVVVGKAGSATTTWAEIDRLGSQPQGEGAVCSPESIDRVVGRLRREGKRIVFTNGCFDLLHRGHVEYLKASRACGDCLIVGINSDASIRRLKGAKRPVVGQEDRAHILAALGAVDYVVIFHEDTPCELLRLIRPDVLTKGGDYQLDGVVGRELAGEVRLISFFDDQSTSRTIDRIQQAA
ncbi:MAG: hypothetical protein BMS9Abin04_124 [Planctomycetia bacterium]|nr:MAG: hypothetical protein BMS9Abin04_124 [Planctomycetia bacterium]